MNFTPQWPHGSITSIFENIFMVTGTNIANFEAMEIQHSRNMTIIVDNGELTLINTVRLDEKSLRQVEKLGKVKHVIRIGAFHGRDDAFYIDRYKAEFWAFAATANSEGLKIDHSLHDGLKLPFANGTFFAFLGAALEEGYIHLATHNGIVISCDSIKNWTSIDEYFSEETGKMNLEAGEIQEARISPIWLGATKSNRASFSAMLKLDFSHLMSAHGGVLKDTAYEAVEKSVAALT